MSEPMDAAAERDALLDFMRSPGWDLFVKAAKDAYGAEASLARIDKTVDVLDPGAVETEREAIRSIRAESRAVMALLNWPEQRLAEIQKPAERAGFMRRIRV